MTRATFVALATMAVIAWPWMSGAATLPPECRTLIDSQVPGWQPALPPPELAALAKERSISTNLVQGDFDGDGTQDTAVLLNASPMRGAVQYIGACLAGLRFRLHLISAPYCGDGISVVPKGARAKDLRTGRAVTYRSDGIHAYCFEKAGGTYVFRNNRWRLIVDSD